MRTQIYSRLKILTAAMGPMLLVFLLLSETSFGQNDSSALQPRARVRPVKNTFMSQWIIDNQTVMVPVKGTLELDFQHRFGVVTNGYQDLWGFFSPSYNVRLGVSYTFIKNLSLGLGISKTGLLWDGSAKYSIITQTPGKYPVSATFFGDWAINTQKDGSIYDGSQFQHTSDRFTFFSSLIVARKITEKFSAQAIISWSHQNAVGGYYTKNDSTGSATYQSMYHDHFAIGLSAKYSVSEVSAIIIDFNQPLTHHPAYNPNPSLGFGYEVVTTGHAFQFFLTNYTLLNPQNNNMYNHNNPFGYTDNGTSTYYPGGQWVLGFNLTKLWNY